MVIPILTGVRSGNLASLSMARLLSAPAPFPEGKILVNDHAERPSGADGYGGLDVEVLRDDLLARLTGGLLGGLANGTDKIAVAAYRQLGADAEQCGQRHPLE